MGRLPEVAVRISGALGRIISAFLYPIIQGRDFKVWQANHPEGNVDNWWKAAPWAIIGLFAYFAINVIILAPSLLSEEVRNININVSSPARVIKGEEVVLAVQIENTAPDPQLLNNIDVGVPYLEAVHIVKADPPYSSSPATTFPLGRSYIFEETIPAKSKMTIQFHALAQKAGDFSTQVSICINSPTNCVDYPIRIVVADSR
jgi:hypothetical protein